MVGYDAIFRNAATAGVENIIVEMEGSSYGDVLRSVREEILDNGAEIAAAIRKAKGFAIVEENKLKRVPTGFPADSEYAEMLKLKDFYIAKKITEEFLLGPEPCRAVRLRRDDVTCPCNNATAFPDRGGGFLLAGASGAAPYGGNKRQNPPPPENKQGDSLPAE